MSDKTYSITPISVGRFYFESIERFTLVLFGVLCSTIACLLLVISAISFIIFVIIAGTVLYLFFISAARARADFINRGGRYRVRRNWIEFVDVEGDNMQVNVADLKLKVKNRSDRSDITFGRGLGDFVAHFGSNKQEGFGLYSIDTACVEDVLAVLQGSR